MKLSSLPQYKRNAKRFEEIVRILARYGLADWLKPSAPEFLKQRLIGADGEELVELSSPRRIRMALTELGTTFIKLGQMLSTRADLVGQEIADELGNLQSNTPFDSREQISERIQTELGMPLEELFAEFQEQPLASASIAQAHRATLHDGREVVVKVQHEGIEEKVINDLEILVTLAGLAEKYSEDLMLYQPKATAAEFRRNLLRELDFGQELQHLVQFRENFKDDLTVHIPEPFPDLSARRVLTMEKLNGVSVARKEQLAEQEGFDGNEVAKRGANIYLEMIFRDRIYHADPHPGNLFILPGNVIGLLDFGMIGHLDNHTSECFEGLVQGFLEKDSEVLTDYGLKLGYAPPEIDRDRLQGDIDLFVSSHLSGSLNDMDISRVLSAFVEIIQDHRIVLRPGFSLLIKVLIMLEGTSRLLSRDFNLAALLEPFYHRMVKRKLSPKSLLDRLKKTGRDWDRLLESLPRDVADILRQIRSGTLDVHLEHRRLDPIVNRIAFAMVTAALLLGSALLWSRSIPPLIGGVSVIGAGGLALSIYLAWLLLRAIRKSGGM